DHHRMLGQLLRVVSACEPAQNNAVVAAQESEVVDPATQSGLQPILQLIESFCRIGRRGCRDSVLGHTLLLANSHGATLGSGGVMLSDDGGGLGNGAVGWLPLTKLPRTPTTSPDSFSAATGCLPSAHQSQQF